MKRLRQETLDSLPEEWPVDLLPSIREDLKTSESPVVVLDDDPTGTQTVYDTPVLTDWSPAALTAEFNRKTPLFYVLTNSRSLPEEKAVSLAGEIGNALGKAAASGRRGFTVISRSDSTLRGHYPAEVNALAEAVGTTDAVHVIIPFFLEGGRYTLEDTHYVSEGDTLVPAAETPFARDAAFGYRSSHLCRWVEEKTKGALPAAAVASISIADIRTGGPEPVRERFLACPERGACIVNAASYRDLEVVTRGLIDAEKQGKQFLCRTAASYVRVRAGLGPRPLVTAEDLELPRGGGGLIVVGSYVPKSSTQLAHLLEHAAVTCHEVRVESLLEEKARQAVLERTTAALDAALDREEDVVLCTSRDLVRGADGAASLAVGSLVSGCIVTLVKAVAPKARYILAKGGITASHIATEALGVKRGWALGQIAPGVPVWRLGDESLTPGLSYIVFPGNVGEADTMTRMVRSLARKRP
jgi:uncharacterized protein YgbK (DUF1537 family)